MAGQAAMGKIAAGSEAPERRWKRWLLPRFGPLWATGALLVALGAGFAVTRFLGSDIVDISVGVALAALYASVLVLLWRTSSSERQDGVQSRTEEMKDGYESIVSVLCAALDLRDSVTHSRSQRVSEIASIVAWQMGLRKEKVRQIEKAAILHDIGKIGVADAVFAKTGPLDDQEWAEMKRHPELEYRILNWIDFLRDAAEVARSHHERFDGSGYPRALKGEEIPIGARIFAVADAYNAMTSQRPYREAQPHRKAVDEIVRNSGSQFDPDVVRAFIEAEKRGLLEYGHKDGDRNTAPARRAGEDALTTAG